MRQNIVELPLWRGGIRGLLNLEVMNGTKSIRNATLSEVNQGSKKLKEMFETKNRRWAILSRVTHEIIKLTSDG